jgi:hypothetical protein
MNKEIKKLEKIIRNSKLYKKQILNQLGKYNKFITVTSRFYWKSLGLL